MTVLTAVPATTAATAQFHQTRSKTLLNDISHKTQRNAPQLGFVLELLI
jgi:hypothetical protein